MTGNREAIVVGGGIGGLAAAIALGRRGWAVRVFERAPEIGEVGAGISLWSNALRALDALGVGDRVRARAQEEGSAAIRDRAGRALTRPDTEALRARYGLPIVLHRADLLDILRGAVPDAAVHTGLHVTRADPEGGLTTADGRRHTADLIVGADGIRSVVRQAVCGEVEPRYAGYTAWRTVLTPRAPMRDLAEIWGRGERFGYTPLPDGRVYCFAAATLPEGTRTDGLPELLRRFGDWPDPVPRLLADADPAAILQHDIHQLPALPHFTRGRIALLGDAAHAMTPNLGQGACQALEDAVILADCAARDDLDRYDRLRRPRTRMISRRSERIGVVAQLSSGPLVALRDLAMRATPSRAQLSALAPVLDWTPEVPSSRPTRT